MARRRVRHPHPGVLRIALPAALAVVAACGGSPAPTPAGGGTSTSSSADGSLQGSHPDACRLLTLDEAKTAMGRPVQHDGASTSALGEPQCRYTVVASATDIDVSSIEIKYIDPAIFTAVQGSTAQTGLPVTPLAGVGDQAMYQDAGGFSLLYVRKGDADLIVTIIDNRDPGTAKDREKTVALQALSRL